MPGLLPDVSKAGAQYMIGVGASEITVIAEVDGCALRDGGVCPDAENHAVARSRGPESREPDRRSANERRRDRPRQVGELMAPSEPDCQIEALVPRRVDRGPELGAQYRAQRLRGLLSNGKVERIGAGFREAGLRRGRGLQPRERHDEAAYARRGGNLVARLELAKEGIGDGVALRRTEGQAGDDDRPCHAVVAVTVARQRIEIEGVLLILAVEGELQGVGRAIAWHALGIETRGVEARSDTHPEVRCDTAVEAGNEATETVGEAVTVVVAGNCAEGPQRATPGTP